MKIVHVIPAFTKGGAERVVVDLANASAEKGHCVSIVAGFHVPEEQLLCDLREDIAVRYVGMSSRSIRSSYIALLPWLVRNRRWLLSQDVVHCHLTFGAIVGSLVGALKRLLGRRLPLVIETYHAVGMPIPKAQRRLHAALMRGRDGVVLMAEDRYWTRFIGGRSQPAALIPNGVRTEIKRPCAAKVVDYRAAANIPGNARVVGTVGRLVPARRPDLMINIFAEVARRTDADVHILIAGDGSERAWLEREVDRLGLADRVHLPGLVLEPATAFCVIDVYVTLNVGPVTGVAALEAAAFGLPIVGLQLLEDYHSTSSDWIWSSGDVERLSQCIVQLVQDPQEARALAERQRTYVLTNHPVGAMAEAYHQFYGRVFGRFAVQPDHQEKE